MTMGHESYKKDTIVESVAERKKRDPDYNPDDYTNGTHNGMRYD